MSNYKYMRLAELLKTDIANAVFSAGDQIPTEDALMARFNVSRNTVRQAVKSLVGQGCLHKVQGSGTYVSENAVAGKRNHRGNGGGKRIGVLLNHHNAYIFPRVLMGINDYLSEHGYSMMLRIAFNHIAKEEEALGEMTASNLDGLIIEPARSGLPRVNGELYRNIAKTMPCLLMHAKFPELDIPSVTLDDMGGVGQLVDHLTEKGHKDIGAFMKFDEYPGLERFQGYVSALRKHGLTFDESRIMWYSDEDDLNELFSEANAHRIQKVIAKTSAVICYNDELVPPFYSFLKKEGIVVPNDISVVGYDDSSEGKILPPTTIEHPKERFGHAVAEAILTLIDNPDQDVSQRIPARLIVRDSVGAPHKTGAGNP